MRHVHRGRGFGIARIAARVRARRAAQFPATVCPARLRILTHWKTPPFHGAPALWKTRMTYIVTAPGRQYPFATPDPLTGWSRPIPLKVRQVKPGGVGSHVRENATESF